MLIVPNTNTVETATDTCSARPFSTGSVAITAAAPQIELPAPIKITVLVSNLNTLRPTTQANAKVLVSTNTSIKAPCAPTWVISANVNLKP